MLALKIFLKNLKKSFETEFKDNLEHIERYTRVFNDEITLAHRVRIDASTKQIQQLVGTIALDNVDLVNRADSRDAYRESRHTPMTVFYWTFYSISTQITWLTSTNRHQRCNTKMVNPG